MDKIHSCGGDVMVIQSSEDENRLLDKPSQQPPSSSSSTRMSATSTKFVPGLPYHVFRSTNKICGFGPSPPNELTSISAASVGVPLPQTPKASSLQTSQQQQNKNRFPIRGQSLQPAGPPGRNYTKNMGPSSFHYGQHNRNNQPNNQTNRQETNEPIESIKILVNHNRKTTDSDHVLPEQHLLQDVWTFWYLRFEKNFSWEHSQLEIGTCSTVEQFWGIFDQLLPLTEAHHGCNYSLFKKGIRPIWEDPMNRHGGRFVFTITKEDRCYKEFADRMWLEFSMAVVGNILPNVSDQICGIIGGNRNNMIKIAVWTRDCEKLSQLKLIGQHFKTISQYTGMVPYEVHMDSQLQRPSITPTPNGKILFKV